MKVAAPPDGGWGYMICVGFTIIFATCAIPTQSFGAIFENILINSNLQTDVISIMQVIRIILICFSGVLVHICLKWFSVRKIAFFGSFCYTTSLLFNAFVTNIEEMFILNGILNAFGVGLLSAASYVVFNRYFLKRRVMLMCICLTLVGLFSLGVPWLIEYLMETFGFRGTVALIAAISGNTFIGSALYQPSKWHRKMEKIKFIEMKYLDNECDIQNEKLRDQRHLLVQNNRVESYVDANFLTEREEQIYNNIKNQRNPLRLDQSEQFSAKKLFWRDFRAHLNLKLFKNFTFINICLAMSTGIMGDVFFFTALPLILNETNFTLVQITACVTIVSICDVLSKILLAIANIFINVSSCYLYYSVLILTFIARLLFLQCNDLHQIAIALAFLGFLRGLMYVNYPFLCAEALPKESYESKFGLASFVSAIYGAILALIISCLNTSTGSYGAFYLITCSSLISIIPWTIEIFIKSIHDIRNSYGI